MIALRLTQTCDGKEILLDPKDIARAWTENGETKIRCFNNEVYSVKESPDKIDREIRLASFISAKAEFMMKMFGD